MSSDGCKSEFFFALNFFNFSFYRENEWVLVILIFPPCWSKSCSTLWFLWTWLKNQTKWKSPFSSLSLKKYQLTLRSPLIRYMRFELTNKTSVIITLIQVQWNEQHNDNLAPVKIEIGAYDFQLKTRILWNATGLLLTFIIWKVHWSLQRFPEENIFMGYWWFYRSFLIDLEQNHIIWIMIWWISLSQSSDKTQNTPYRHIHSLLYLTIQRSENI